MKPLNLSEKYLKSPESFTKIGWPLGANRQSRAMSSWLIILYPVIGGWIATRWGYETVFALAAVVILIGAVLALWLPSPVARRDGSSEERGVLIDH